MTFVLQLKQLIFFSQILIGIEGFCQGYVYSAVPGQIFALWEGNRMKGPALQTANTLWSVGCAVSPYIALPFLADLPAQCRGFTNENDYETDKIEDFENVTNVLEHTELNITTSLPHVGAKCETDVTNVRYSFKLIGFGAVVASVLFLSMFVITGPSIKRRNYLKKTDDEKESMYNSSEKTGFQYTVTAGITIMYYFVICYSYLPITFLATFVIQGLGWSIKDGPILTSFFTGSLGIGRVLSIPLTYFVPPNVMISLLVLTSTLHI